MSDIDNFLDGTTTKPVAPAGAQKQYSQIDDFLGDAPAPARGLKGWGQDIAASAVKGAIGVPEMLVGLADIPTGGRAGKFLANESGDFGFRPKEAKEIVNDWHSDATKEAQRKFGEAKGIWDKAKTAIENPSVIANSVGESLFLMGSGSLAARGLMALGARGVAGAAGGVGPALPGALARTVGAEAAPIAAGAIGEGVTMAGSAAEQIRQETKDGLLTPTQSGLALATGGVGAAFGYAGGKLAHKFGFGDADTMLAQGARGVAREAEESAAARTGAAALQRTALSNIPKKVIQGAISEGFFEELPQSVAEQIFQNMALDKPWDTDLDSASVMGVLSGAAMGGPASGVHAYGQYRNGNAPQPPGQQQGQPPGTQPNNSAPPVNPGLERVRQAFLEQLQALQAQEQGEPTVPQVEPPNGAAILAQRQAENRAITSPDDEIYQSTGYNEYAQRQSEIANQPPELNPSLERARQGLTNQLEHLQTQEQGEPTVPQAAPPDGAAVLARQQAQQQAARDAVNQVNRAVTSPDDEIYQSTGRGFTPSQRMGINPKAGPLSAGAAIALDTGVSTPIQQAAAMPTSLRAQSGDDAGSVWSQMPTAQRMELAQRVDLKPIIKNNLHSAQWEGINPEIQSKLAQAMQTQGGLATTSELAQSQPTPEAPLTRAPDIATGPARVLQNRDRSTAASIGQMNDIASAPDYLRAGQARVMDSGAPVVFGAAPTSALMGKQQQIADGHGARVPVQYAVVEAADVLPSHQADGTPIAQYQQGVPGQLRAVAGNGRAAGITEAYRRGTTTQYRQDLIDDAPDLGVDPEAISAMSAPMLVRVMPEEHVTDDAEPSGSADFEENNAQEVGSFGPAADGGRTGVPNSAESATPAEQGAGSGQSLAQPATKGKQTAVVAKPESKFSSDGVGPVTQIESAKTLWKVQIAPPAATEVGKAQTSETLDRNTSTGDASLPAPPDSAQAESQAQPAQEVGNFGPILTQFKGDAQGAIKALTELQSGEAVAALSHPEVGDIDLVWGETSDNPRKKGEGLAKIAKWHPEVLDDLQGFIDGLHIHQRHAGRIHLTDGKNERAAVRLDFNGATKTWLLTAYDIAAENGKAANKDTARGVTSGISASAGLSDGTILATPSNASDVSVMPSGDGSKSITPPLTPKAQATKDKAQSLGIALKHANGKSKALPILAAEIKAKEAALAAQAAQPEGLTSPTAEEVVAQQDQAEAAAKAETAQRRAQDERDRLERIRKDIAKASIAAADEFVLGGDAEQNLSGQRDIFGEAPEPIKSEPADKPAPTKPDSPAMFATGGATTGSTILEVEQVLSEFTQRMKNAPLGKVVQTASDLPFSAPSDAKGAYWRGSIYLVADNIASAQDAREVIAHEVIGHFGLRGFFGRELDAVLNRIHESNPRVQMQADKWQQDNQALIAEWKTKYGMTDAQLKARSIEEALAGFAEKGEALKGWRRLAAVLQTLLRKMGAAEWANALEAKTDAEALLALKKAEMFVRRGVTQASSIPEAVYPFFSRLGEQTQTEDDAAFSRKDELGSGSTVNWTDSKDQSHAAKVAVTIEKAKPGKPAYDYTIVEPQGSGRSRGNRTQAGAKNISDALDERVRGFERAFGRTVIFVRANGASPSFFNGFILPKSDPNTIYVNADASVNLMSVLGHEFYEGIAAKSPTLHAWFVTEAVKQLEKGALTKYSSRLAAAGDTQDIAGRFKELLADFTGDALADPLFRQSLNDANPSRFKVLIRALMAYLQKVLNRLTNTPVAGGLTGGKDLGSSEYFKDIQTLRAVLKDVIKQADSGGNLASFLSSNAMFSRSLPDVSDPRTGISTALLELGQADNLFQYPRSDALYLEHIAEDKSVIGDDGKPRTIEVLPVDRSTDDAAQWMLSNTTPKDDDATDTRSWMLKTPTGKWATLTKTKGTVYINVSGVGEGNGGSAIYDLAANFALNNGLTFVGDPNGVSPAAMRRRLENMLSSAIKYGTTDHLQPHPDQYLGDTSIGVPELDWKKGDTLGNIRSMIDVSIAATEHLNPIATHNVKFQPATQSFVDGGGQRFELGNLAQDLSQVLGFDGRAGGTGQAGHTTLRRHALFQSLLQSVGNRTRFVAQLHSEQSRGGTGVGSALEKTFYSRGSAPGKLGVALVQASANSLTRHWANAPEVVVLSSMDDARVPQAVRDEDARQRSQGATGKPEGFVHEGVVYLVADQLATAADVKRVLMHEALGHIGLRGVFGNGLNQVLNQVILGRRAEVSAKAAQYGLDMDDPAQRLDAAEELLAEMAQANPQLGFVKRAVSAIRNWLRTHGFSRLKLTDNDIIQAYILPARGWVERGMEQQGKETRPNFSRSDTKPEDFITAPDGSINFGEITPDMAKIMKRQSGKIRLQQGVQNANGTGYGLLHIEANHGAQIRAMGFSKIEDFVANVAKNFSQVWQTSNTQLLVTVNDGRKDVMYVRLEPSETGDFYRINSAFPVRQRDYEEKRDMKKLWDGSEPASAVTGQQPAYATKSPDELSSQGSPNARGQSNQSVQGENNSGNPDIRFSRSKIVGQTTRPYTADVLAAMRRTGMQVEVPTLQERAKALWADAGKKLTQGIVDQFSPVKELSQDAYRLLRMSKGASGAFEALMHGGRLKLTDGVYDIDRAQRGGAVEKLLKPMQGEHHDFLRWVAANRAERLLGDGREHLFTQQDIDALKTLADGTLNHAYTLKNGARAGQTTTDRREMYQDSLVTFNEFNANALDMAEQSGLINADGRKDWESEFYVPFYRAMQEDGSGVVGGNIKSGVVRQSAFKHLKGGKDKLNADLLDNTLMNWAHLLDAGAKNRAALATLEAAQGMGVAIEASADVARDIGKATHNRDGVVWAMDEGVQRYFVVDDPYILTALTSLEYAGMKNPVMNAMGTMKRVLTIGVTASPFFKIRNLIRDSVQAIGLGDMSYNIGSNLKEGWKLTDPKSDAYFSLLASGGTIHFGSMYEGNESKRIQALVESGIDRDTILNDPYRVKEFYRKTLEPMVTAYNEVGNRGEAINRAALYDQLVKKGVSHAEAALQARDLMDFSMQGAFTSVRFLTQVVPFMNARLQGLYKLGKSAKENPQRFTTVLAAVAAVSLALLAAYGDDDDWKRRDESDRNNFWWLKIGGVAYRVPKPFEVGAIATLAERGFELAFDKEMTGPRFRTQVLKLLGDNLSMNPVPQLVKPMLDVYSNIDGFTDRPIESMGMDKLKSEYRYNDRTSMVARGASTAMNAATGLLGKEALSPVQIDHMLRGYFGWLGSFVVGTADLLARPATGQVDKAAPDHWKTLTGNMASDLRDAPSRYVSQMYEQAKEIERAYGTWRELQKQGKTQEAQEFRSEHLKELNQYHHVEAVKRQEALFNQQSRRIERSDMQPDMKRERLRAIGEQKHKLAKSLV